jgi:hypothetical protein
MTTSATGLPPGEDEPIWFASGCIADDLFSYRPNEPFSSPRPVLNVMADMTEIPRCSNLRRQPDVLSLFRQNSTLGW